MEKIDEELLRQENTHHLVFVSLWPRVGALFLDFIVLLPFQLLMYYNVIYWKSTVVFIAIYIVLLAYKPILEYFFGYTMGKKWMGQCVINEHGLVPTLSQALLRNSFRLVAGFFSLYVSYSVFQLPEFTEIRSYREYGQMILSQPNYRWSQTIFGCIVLLDAIVLWRDPQRRSLHDKIASTWVVKE